MNLSNVFWSTRGICEIIAFVSKDATRSALQEFYALSVFLHNKARLDYSDTRAAPESAKYKVSAWEKHSKTLVP